MSKTLTFFNASRRRVSSLSKHYGIRILILMIAGVALLASYWFYSGPGCRSDLYYVCANDPLVKTVKRFNQAMLSRDMETVKAFLDKNAMLRSREGDVALSSEFLDEEVKNDIPPFSTIQYESIQARRYEQKAEVKCVIVLSNPNKTGQKFRYKYILEQSQDKWKIMTMFHGWPSE